jgi:hypothetical protein
MNEEEEVKVGVERERERGEKMRATIRVNQLLT